MYNRFKWKNYSNFYSRKYIKIMGKHAKAGGNIGLPVLELLIEI
jgi:hypothetical protein